MNRCGWYPISTSRHPVTMCCRAKHESTNKVILPTTDFAFLSTQGMIRRWFVFLTCVNTNINSRPKLHTRQMFDKQLYLLLQSLWKLNEKLLRFYSWGNLEQTNLTFTVNLSPPMLRVFTWNQIVKLTWKWSHYYS